MLHQRLDPQLADPEGVLNDNPRDLSPGKRFDEWLARVKTHEMNPLARTSRAGGRVRLSPASSPPHPAISPAHSPTISPRQVRPDMSYLPAKTRQIDPRNIL